MFDRACIAEAKILTLGLLKFADVQTLVLVPLGPESCPLKCCLYPPNQKGRPAPVGATSSHPSASSLTHR